MADERPGSPSSGLYQLGAFFVGRLYEQVCVAHIRPPYDQDECIVSGAERII